MSYQSLPASMPTEDRPTVGPPHGAHTGETPHHRIVFHRDLKHTLGTFSNRFAYFGLFLLMFAFSCELLLILGPPRSIWITGAISGWFGTWWYAVPLWNRARHRPRHRNR